MTLTWITLNSQCFQVYLVWHWHELPLIHRVFMCTLYDTDMGYLEFTMFPCVPWITLAWVTLSSQCFLVYLVWHFHELPLIHSVFMCTLYGTGVSYLEFTMFSSVPVLVWHWHELPLIHRVFMCTLYGHWHGLPWVHNVSLCTLNNSGMGYP